MDFKQLEAFIEVAKLKSFSKAADKIFLSQPTISSHIASLEKELNTQLFDRTSKEVNLTPAGISFLDYAVDIINTRNNAISHVSSFNKNICGTLNLAASTTPCNSIVPKLILNFSKNFPDTDFNIKELSSGEILKKIYNLEFELGIVGINVDDNKIKSYKLVDDELVIISNPSLKLPDEIPLDVLKTHNIILREKSSATRTIFENALNENYICTNSLKVICEINNLDTLIQFVKTGMGISVISKNVAKNYKLCKDLKISYIKDLSIKRNIYLVFNSKRTLTPCAKAFLNLCKEEYGF